MDAIAGGAGGEKLSESRTLLLFNSPRTSKKIQNTFNGNTKIH